MADQRAKVDIGFTGGQVLALRVDKANFDELRKAVEELMTRGLKSETEL